MGNEIHPHKALIKRIEALKDYVSPLQIMAEAKVTYANFHNWQKNEESQGLLRWSKLVALLGYECTKIPVGFKTYQEAKRLLLTQDAVKALFVKVGFSGQTVSLWIKTDPRHVKNYIKVNQVVLQYEEERKKEVAV